MFGPVLSGPKAQIDLAANKSQSYFVWKNSPNRFLKKTNLMKKQQNNIEFLIDVNGKEQEFLSAIKN